MEETFETQEKLKQWLSKLSDKQINNFVSLNINPREIKFPLELLINDDLLDCEDYNKRVEAISTLKNGDGCFHLFDRLCTPNFLKSPNFYKDIEKLCKADTARYGLWIIDKDSFINSPYHDEDLKLIVEIHDIDKKEPRDYVVSEALATVASSADSINSPYHQADMKLIASVGSDALQAIGSFPESSINNLAINKVSLEDSYHLENMQILAKNEYQFLYKIMTNPDIVKVKNYRKEVEALAKAKSRLNAKALYYYIINPERKDPNIFCEEDYQYYLENHIDWSNNTIAGNSNPNYLENLNIINQISSEFSLYYVSLLMDKKFMDSSYSESDLQILREVSDRKIFIDLYKYIKSPVSSINSYHKFDVGLLSKVTDNEKRKLVLSKALDEYSIKSSNRQYDLGYIVKSNIGNVNSKIENAMRYYLFDPKGMDAYEHVEALETLNRGIMFKKTASVLNYLDVLEEVSKTSTQEIESIPNNKEKKKTLNIFKRYKRN